MLHIDVNCDMGECIGNDALIMPFISSANIACGFHAGNEETIEETIALCTKYKVAIGAHPGFEDKKNFGRKEMRLSVQEIYTLISRQLEVIDLKIINGQKLMHVKPHGALYNMSARDAVIAKAIADAVKDHNEKLVLYGLSGSHSIAEAKKIGLKTASEVFADRTYQDDGSLTSRSEVNSLIDDPARMLQQVLQMVKENNVTTISGNKIPLVVDTICIHGDGKNAVTFAKLINHTLKEENIAIKPIE